MSIICIFNDKKEKKLIGYTIMISIYSHYAVNLVLIKLLQFIIVYVNMLKNTVPCEFFDFSQALNCR